MTKPQNNISSEDDGSCRIADAGNTYNSALTIIKSKGYKLFLIPDAREDFYGNYWAIKGQRDFIASDPLRLLGLITIWENLGDDWQRQKKLVDEDIKSELGSKAFPNNLKEIEELSAHAFKELVSDYRILFNRLYIIDRMPLDISKAKFYETISNYYKEDYDSD